MKRNLSIRIIKIIDGQFLINGEIAGKVVLNTAYKNIALKKMHMQAAWDILSNIKDHTSPWIVETKKWSTNPFLFHLL